MSKHAIAYTSIIVAATMITAFTGLLASGKVPIPAEWVWITPCLVAGLTALTTQLPKLEAQDGTAPTEPPK